MTTSMGPRLLRFLLTLVSRPRLSAGRIALAFRARFASLWRSFLTFVRHHSDQSRIRLLASDVPGADNNHGGERSRVSERGKIEEENRGTLATLPVRCNTNWHDIITRYQTSPSEFVLLPATPDSASRRYEPKKAIPNNPDPPVIPPGPRELLSLSELPRPPDRWRRHVHPEGNVLYYHEELRIFTESDIFNREEEIICCATRLVQQAIQIGDNILDDLTEIVLNVDKDGDWHYYFVDHTNRLLYWVQSVQPRDDLGTELQGITEYSHIKYYVEAQYWYASPNNPSGMYYVAYNSQSRWHCEYFPHGRILPKRVYDSLRGILNFAKTDTMTGDSSPSPFAQSELVPILDLVNSLKDDETISDPYNIWIVSRLMALFTENRFMNFAGQACARLNADTALFEQQHWNRRIIFKLVDVFLFGSPNEHSLRLKRVWVDGIIIQPRWKDFVTRLTTELARYTIFSTVMLAVNFSFLAVPGVVSPGSPATSIQIIIYCSIISTVASIVFSFSLLNVYSDPGLVVAGSVAEVMRTLSEKKLGMACLAITHSLPIACLEWSIMLFFTALIIQIFYPKERATVATLGVVCFVLVLFAAMSIVVMRLFYRNTDVDNVIDAGDMDASAEKSRAPAEPQRDLEQGSGK